MSVGDAHRLLAGLDYPMFVVTTAIGDERDGCLVGFTTQTSIHPQRFLVCLSRRNRTTRLAAHASALAVHVLPSDRLDLGELFGGQTGDAVDKFAQCEWSDGPAGMPIIGGCPSWFVGSILERADLGDHIGHLLDPIEGRLDPAGGQLDFHRARWIDPGHEA
jgi:flavin reductase (DIM6/NTAB) family NADH-FMN oxidoreductase RutF